MQRSSETIGAIAGALAKAQIELDQPGEVADRDHPLARSRAKATAPFATPRLSSGLGSGPQVAWAGTRSPPCRPPRSTRRPD